LGTKLNSKVALITGASRGIGRSLAKGFVREGAKLYLVGHKDERALRETLDELRQAGAEAEGGLFDVGSYTDVVRIAEAVESRYGTLDILVNNAGNIAPTPLLEITPEQWDRTMRTHLYGTFYCTLEMVRRFLKPKRAGKIVNVTAPSAVRGGNGVADYASAKGGIIAFTRIAARELLAVNIQVNAVLPVARSRMTDALAEFNARFSGEEAVARLRNLAPPDVLLPVFLFLASSDSDYITGQVIGADGGLLA
jgi:3-oxoacyl-[acyl-carrier protein] reductase